MKRTQKCFDLQSLEIDIDVGRSKRYRLDSEASDFSGDTDLSDISEDFEKSAVITPTASASSNKKKSPDNCVVSVDMISCQFEFERENYSVGSSVRGSALGNSLRKRGPEDQ